VGPSNIPGRIRRNTSVVDKNGKRRMVHESQMKFSHEEERDIIEGKGSHKSSSSEDELESEKGENPMTHGASNRPRREVKKPMRYREEI
jgi:hypothetical protein